MHPLRISVETPKSFQPLIPEGLCCCAILRRRHFTQSRRPQVYGLPWYRALGGAAHFFGTKVLGPVRNVLRTIRRRYFVGSRWDAAPQYAAAAAAFDKAIAYPHANPGVTAAAALEAGEVYDLTGKRAKAIERYKQAQSIAPPDSPTARAAARYLKGPFTGD